MCACASACAVKTNHKWGPKGVADMYWKQSIYIRWVSLCVCVFMCERLTAFRCRWLRCQQRCPFFRSFFRSLHTHTHTHKSTRAFLDSSNRIQLTHKFLCGEKKESEGENQKNKKKERKMLCSFSVIQTPIHPPLDANTRHPSNHPTTNPPRQSSTPTFSPINRTEPNRNWNQSNLVLPVWVPFFSNPPPPSLRWGRTSSLAQHLLSLSILAPELENRSFGAIKKIII